MDFARAGHFALLMIFGLFLTGCISGNPDLNPISFTPVTLTTSNIQASTTRVFIYGTRSDGQEAFARFFTTTPPTLEMELRTGQWTFYGLSYSGPTIDRCSKLSSKLVLKEKTIDLNFDNSTCAEEEFLGTDPTLNLSALPAVSFPVTAVEFCESVNGITSSTDECTDDISGSSPNRVQARGHAGSYTYKFRAFTKTNGQYTFTDTIESSCRNGVPTAPSLRGSAAGFIGFDVPAGDPNLAPFYMQLEIYPANTSCDASIGSTHTVDLPHGLRSTTSKSKYVVQSGAPSMHKIYVKSSGEEICTGLNTGLEFAGGTGTTTNPRLICNETQLYNIFPEGTGSYNTYSSASYKLLKDVDISSYSIGTNFFPEWQSCVSAGSNFAPIGTSWSGGCSFAVANNVHFDGGGKTIKGLRIFRNAGTVAGLYYALRMNAGGNSQVRRLTLSDSEIRTISYGGTITGDSQKSLFKDITLINPVVITGGSFTGGLVGTSGGDTIEDISITNAYVEGGQFVGGIAGDGPVTAIPTNITRAFVEGTVHSIAVNSTVGGLAGRLGSAGATLTTISESRFIGNVEGGNQVGGLVGQGRALRIQDSYAQANIDTSATNNAQAGGLVGIMDSRIAIASGIYSSYFSGSFTENCTLDNAGCFISTIVGSPDATYLSSEFPSVVYSASSEILFSGTNFGYVQPDASFTSTNPSWVDDTSADLMPFFSPTIWQFSNSAEPVLLSEP